eukprot:TRINITY_DN5357_c0_g1_i1.p1 TRINITY_DN5357_c0_g1~~TRINITY_DN5357_c0_g1_i1.p1  ORF type:complete len:101 (+),score=7.01 TRINITY_DN5357_c0_g1_i1:680-982(+)
MASPHTKATPFVIPSTQPCTNDKKHHHSPILFETEGNSLSIKYVNIWFEIYFHIKFDVIIIMENFLESRRILESVLIVLSHRCSIIIWKASWLRISMMRI